MQPNPLQLKLNPQISNQHFSPSFQLPIEWNVMLLLVTAPTSEMGSMHRLKCQPLPLHQTVLMLSRQGYSVLFIFLIKSPYLKSP